MQPHAILGHVSDRKGPRTRATYDDLLKVPDHLVAEIIDGVLYTSPRPAFRHSRASTKLTVDLGRFDEDGGDLGGWWILSEPEFHFGEDVVVPDLAGWRVERMPEFPIDAKFGTLAPDWLCETLSPSTARLDRKKKLPVYAREGVRHVWFLDPKARTLEVFVLEGTRLAPQATYGAEDCVRAAPFEAIEIKLAPLWNPRSTASRSPR